MKLHILFLLLALFAFDHCSAAYASTKPRVFVLTDIENEPDDAMSLVRFLTYSNHWDVEGLVATTSLHQKDKVAAWRIREILDAYAKVRHNLEQHEPGYPSPEHLRSVVAEGRSTTVSMHRSDPTGAVGRTLRAVHAAHATLAPARCTLSSRSLITAVRS